MRHAMIVVVSLAMTVAACGGDGETSGKGLDRFVGIWSPSSGMLTATCNGRVFPEPVTENLIWQTGSSSDLIQSLGESCVLRANVAGGTASLATQSSCTTNGVDSYGYPFTDVFNFGAYTFVLGADGLTATENLSGNVVETIAGQSINCSFNQTAAYQKQ
jgi:hypothetical protein